MLRTVGIYTIVCVPLILSTKPLPKAAKIMTTELWAIPMLLSVYLVTTATISLLHDVPSVSINVSASFSAWKSL